MSINRGLIINFLYYANELFVNIFIQKFFNLKNYNLNISLIKFENILIHEYIF